MKSGIARVAAGVVVVVAGAFIAGCGDSEEPASVGGGGQSARVAAALSPEEALSAYMDAARKGDLDGMIAVCASEEAQELREVKEAPPEQRKATLEMLKSSAPADFEIQKTETEGNRATITYTGTVFGEKGTEKAVLVNEDGWKVKSM